MSKSKNKKKKFAAPAAAKTSPKKTKAPVEAKKPKAADKAPKATKLGLVIELLSRPDGATIDNIIAATGWQKHTARACISHALGKKRGFKITSEKSQDGARVYKAEVPAKDDH
jgi:hypothetical protein